jgi:dienelactone hydrolase
LAIQVQRLMNRRWKPLKKTKSSIMYRCFASCALLLALTLCSMASPSARVSTLLPHPQQDSTRVLDSLRHASPALDWLLGVMPADMSERGRISYQDYNFYSWLVRTKELPPDFEALESVPYLRNPFRDKDGDFVRSPDAWSERRAEIKKKLAYYITGSFPKEAFSVNSTVLETVESGGVVHQRIELRFGPDQAAKLNIELYFPKTIDKDVQMPVFLTQWNHREWAQIAVKRGYIGCIYAGADAKDDTDDYSRIWKDGYDFSLLMRRAFGASRVIDYLYQLPFVDTAKIAITGHSRNAKQSLTAAAMDERITAVVGSSGGTGAEIPWRFTSHDFDVEDIALLTTARPSWFHPRLRFFIGREDKLPVDQHDLMASIAPRALMISTAQNEAASNPLGTEKAFAMLRDTYAHLGAEDKLVLQYREGLHGTNADDIEGYLDFFDYVFGRRDKKVVDSDLFFTFHTEQRGQVGASGQGTNVLPEYRRQTAYASLETMDEWNNRRDQLKNVIRHFLGEEPPRVTNEGPKHLKASGRGESYFGSVVSRPSATAKMGRMNITPYSGFGEYLYGYLYYPKEQVERGEQVPVVIYLHEFDYSKGFSSMSLDHAIQPFFEDLVESGYAVLAYDMLGFGTRLKEGAHFYDRYPNWSKMGAHVRDLGYAVDALVNMDMIDANHIYTLGYSLGGAVGMFAAAFDERITGVIASSAITSLRVEGQGKSGGLYRYAKLHNLIPKLLDFDGMESNVPFDFDDVLALVAPIKTLIIAPQKDGSIQGDDLRKIVAHATHVYDLFGEKSALNIHYPMDYNRFSSEIRNVVIGWLKSEPLP